MHKSVVIAIFVGAFLSISVVLKVDALVPTEDALTQIAKQGNKTLYPEDAIYNSNVSRVLSTKNLSLSPYRITDERFFEHGILKGVGNITNNQTFIDTHISDDLIRGKGNGTFATPDGQSIKWITSDLGRRNGTQWVYYGVMLFNSTNSKSFSILNNSLALSKSSYPLMEPEYIWLLK